MQIRTGTTSTNTRVMPVGGREKYCCMITNKRLYPLLLLCLSFNFSNVYAQNNPPDTLEPILPLPSKLELDLDKVALGKTLFFDKRLSKNGDIACADCHQLDSGGDSGRVSDVSHGYSNYLINTPTIFNARYNFRQNWDGSDASLKQQLKRILDGHPPFETSIDKLILIYRSDKTISSRFSTIYRSGLTRESLLDSLVEFEKSLVTPNSRFDKFLNGDKTVLSEDERSGYHMFKSLGCVSCHQGINIGGNLYQKFGVFYNYIAERGSTTAADYGRINVTGRSIDEFVFKVPSLRNIAVTAPYLHDGSASTLEEAIFIVGKTQLGRNLTGEQVYLLKAFLLTLTGEYNDSPLSDTAQ